MKIPIPGVFTPHFCGETRVATIQRRINYLYEVMPGARGAKPLNM
jgi:hypothetical protein